MNIALSGRNGEYILLPCFSIITKIAILFKKSSFAKNRRNLYITTILGEKNMFELATNIRPAECRILQADLQKIAELWEQNKKEEYIEEVRNHKHLFLLGE